jgi:hypothetical protein
VVSSSGDVLDLLLNSCRPRLPNLGATGELATTRIG